MRSKSMELMLRIQEYIEGYFERYSSVPTVREIAGAMKIAVSSAHRYLVAMAEKEMVFYENGVLSSPKIQRMTPAVSPRRHRRLHSLRHAGGKGSGGGGIPASVRVLLRQGGLLRPPRLRQLHGRRADRRRRPCYHPPAAYRPGRGNRRSPHR